MSPSLRLCHTSLTISRSDIARLPAFTVQHDFYSSYAFTSLAATITVNTGDKSDAVLACISATITPDMGNTLSSLVRFLPLMVLILVAVATGLAAVYSPWGSTDVFRFTTNYGRDPDLLRLVTPGFADCLQYIQFIVLTGGLTLNYPGFYQPVVSQMSWASLMFNDSFVSHGNGTQAIEDGVYNVNGTYGLDRLSQLVGMTEVEDVWAGMTIWLLVILGAIGTLTQVAFATRWLLRVLSQRQEEDLRRKNMPFTVGNTIRIVFSYFLLPIVSLSMFQLVVSGKSPAYASGLAGVMLLALIGFAAWLLYLIASAKPRSFLFDDLPTVLLYGPLYNTYSDNAATFALVPMILTFARGIAIGAVQPSGIAQLVLLAICEVILVLTLNAFRPFHSPTSMNAYHTFFALARLLAILLMVAFIPSLGITEGPRGWVGYIILFMHAAVLVFGFFLNAIQTLIEVIARLAGAGGENVSGGAARGGLSKVFGMRQLSRRVARRDTQTRHSMQSEAAMLGEDQKSIQLSNRVRSYSGSSALLLNRAGTSDGRASMTMDSMSAATPGAHQRISSGQYTPTTPASPSAITAGPFAGGQDRLSGGETPTGGIEGLQQNEAIDPYYRKPRARRATIDPYSAGARSRGSWASGDWLRRASRGGDIEQGNDDSDAAEGPSSSRPETPTIANPEGLESQEQSPNEKHKSTTDYSTREVDFYYRVRGPALSHTPTRKLKTGPADPTGPVSSATGWFKNMFGAKTKESGKGFEVVRSSRAPPPGLIPEAPEPTSSPDSAGDVPYRDNPEPLKLQKERDLDISDEDIAGPSNRRRSELGDNPRRMGSDDETDMDSEEEFDDEPRRSRISPEPPSLPLIEIGDNIEIPSRMASKASSKRPSRHSTRRRPPSVPRRSSRRLSSPSETVVPKLSAISASPPPSPGRLYNPDSVTDRHLRPSSSGRLSPRPDQLSPSKPAHHSEGEDSNASSMLRVEREERPSRQSTRHDRNSSSALGTLAPDIRGDRPSSVGYVHHHRTRDNIHQASPEDGPNFIGSSAEVVGDPKRRSAGSDD